MEKDGERKKIFEDLPVASALRTMVVPAVISQLIVLIYNMADTFYVGQTGNPYMVAGTSLILPVFNISLCLAGLAGIGCGALISRLLGKGREDEARRVSVFSIYLAVFVAALFAAGTGIFMEPLLGLLGAGENTYRFARQYASCVIVIGGMFAGLFTATEAAAGASFYVCRLGLFVFKTLKLSDLPAILWNTVEQTAKVMFVIATAGFFQYVLLYTRIPQQTIAFVSGTFTSVALVLLIIIAILVIMGCFMEGTAILLITVPIFVPIAKSFNYDLIQLGIVMCIALAVGVLTPPVGLNLYVMASITGEKVMEIAKKSVGYVLIMIAVAIAVAFIPELSLGLAHWVG